MMRRGSILVVVIGCVLVLFTQTKSSPNHPVPPASFITFLPRSILA
jgi:hypothetical protein